MATRFVPSPSGIAAFASSPALVAALKAVAEEAASNARAIAPEDSGDYIDGIGVDAGVEGGKALARINADDPASGYIEFGTEDTPTFAPLRRGAEAAGFEVRS